MTHAALLRRCGCAHGFKAKPKGSQTCWEVRIKKRHRDMFTRKRARVTGSWNTLDPHGVPRSASFVSSVDRWLWLALLMSHQICLRACLFFPLPVFKEIYHCYRKYCLLFFSGGLSKCKFITSSLYFLHVSSGAMAQNGTAGANRRF